LVCIAVSGFAGVAWGETRTFKNLGPQITSLTIQGTTFARDPSGIDVVCTVIRGHPAKLLVFDVRSGELLHRMPLEGSAGAWNAATAADGTVYVTTDSNGGLYRWIPGEQQVHAIGQVAPDQSFAWDVVAGADGEVFIGTYPGCLVIRYHPDDGFSDVGRRAVALGENYARGITYDPQRRKVYVGVGTRAHIIELDPETGQKRDILPAQYADMKFAYSVDAVAGKLFTVLADGAQGVVLDLETGTVEAELTEVGTQQVVSPKSPYDDKVYINRSRKLFSYDLNTHAVEEVPIDGVLDLLGATWMTFDEPGFPGQTLVMLARGGKLLRYHPRTGKHDTIAIKIPPEPTPIHAILCGPDGRIYSGGYLSGGLSAYDPRTGESKQLGSVGQPEGMAVLGEKIYFGVYPRARLAVFDTSKPWDPKAKNPDTFFDLDKFEQDRPFGVLGVEKLNKVFYGTVPDYGKLGGVLAVVDADTQEVTVQPKVIPQHSIISLARAGEMIVGGTSIGGGLGIEPKAKEAKLFLWDPTTSKVVFDTVPIAGAGMVGGLIVATDGLVWGMADRTIFAFDSAERKIVHTELLPLADDPTGRHGGWRDAVTALHPSGHIYGTASSRLFRLDPASRKVEILSDRRAILMAIDNDGRVYFSDGPDLWQYTP
jgi:outer membrane protein assembly factor BamB